MKIGSTRKEIEAVLDTYRNRLDKIPDDLFNVNPPDAGWSYAEVYSHILQSNIGSGFAIEKCTLNNCVPTSRGPSILGLLVLAFGRLPPVKVKVPPAIAAKIQVNNMSKEDTRNMLIKCRKKMDEVIPLIRDASPHRRVKHQRFGMLNAGQWLKFILIHSKHHLKQLDRVEKKLLYR